MSEEKRRIFVIDDEPDLVEVIRYQLQSKGYETYGAHNGKEGLDKLEEVDPHLIILDINMPQMNGIEFFKAICDKNGNPKHPVLVLTARANMEELFRSLSIDGFICKPFDMDALLNEVEIIIERRYDKKEKKEEALKRYTNKILVVEDDKDTLNEISLAFLNEGYSVAGTNTAMSAVERIFQELPGIVLCKIGLPDVSGDIAMSRLKEMPKTMHVRCILYTKDTKKLDSQILKHLCERTGMNLVKYGDPSDLVEIVESQDTE